jgi:argininosuccinate lyase
VLTILKGLPLAYQRDLQEDKPPLFGAVGIYEASLGVLAGMVDTLTVDRERMRDAAAEGYTTATSVADTLVRNGVPFRSAHHVVGTLVAQADAAGTGLESLDDDTFRAALGAIDDEDARHLAADPSIGATLREAADIDVALASCDVIGGTAPARVQAALAAARARLDREG